ncbi:MAG: stage II sporulation protein R [Clostridiales bacterium]|nr:stage II sporulation protein R [Clostridiales bacterium]
MKKFIYVICLVMFVIVGALCVPQKEEYDYLRLHIRANSNSAVDQSVKYEIKAFLVEYLTPEFCNIESKEKAIQVVEEKSVELSKKCDQILRNKGFNYSVNIKVSNEYFPTRTYSNTTLESGYYDAVIVELGEAEGDNWWCVMYPPLCFVNKNENNIQIKYKSKIAEWFDYLFN